MENKTEAIVDFAFEKLLKNFIHQVKKDGILEEIRSRKYYVKPSDKKRLAKRTIKKW